VGTEGLKLDKYDALICDMDGTLVDSVGPNLKAWRVTCDHFGIPWDEPYMDSLGGVPTNATVELLSQRFGVDVNVAAVSDYKEALFLGMDVKPALFYPVYQILRDFSKHKTVAIGTGASREHANKVLVDLEVLPYVNTLVTACDVVNGKPAGDTFVQAAEQMGFSVDQCVVFEDTLTGVRAAEAAGMDCYRFYRGEFVEFIAFNR